jgi:Gram-negative bacterial TonB protein C-terminal
MSKSKRWVSVGLVVIVALSVSFFTVSRASFRHRTPIDTHQIAEPAAPPWASELMLRGMAVKTVMPVFPVSAVRAHRKGVAVAMVYVDPTGHVSRVETVRSPTQSISDSMSNALSQWTFKLEPGMRIISGKITFYFEYEGDKPVVLDPANAGYVGEWPLESSDA